jgi:hypothetical protein
MPKYHQCKLQRPTGDKLSSTSYFVQSDLSSNHIVEESIKWVDKKKAYVGKVINDSWKIVEVYNLSIRTIILNGDGTFTIVDCLC